MLQPRRTRFWLSKAERLAVEAEIEAQIQACLGPRFVPDTPGFNITMSTQNGRSERFSDRGSAPTRDKRGPLVAKLWRRNQTSSICCFYKWIYNTRLKAYDLAKSQYFGSR